MKAFRVAQKRHARSPQDLLSGDGAAKYGGRWNSVGVPAVYCSESLSLCALEILVHLPRGVLRQYRYLEIHVPDDAIVAPAYDGKTDTQHFGDTYLGSSGVLAFLVPSAVNPIEHNLVLNPEHGRFDEVSHASVEPFPMDARLLTR